MKESITFVIDQSQAFFFISKQYLNVVADDRYLNGNTDWNEIEIDHVNQTFALPFSVSFIFFSLGIMFFCLKYLVFLTSH